MTELLLADHNSVYYPVWVCEDASEHEMYAARELAQFLSEMTGVNYPLHISRAAPVHCISVSATSDEALGAEGFTIQTVQGARGIAIEGGLPRGVIYGAYAFLEQLGCRWFSSKVSSIPKRSLLCVPALDIREIPALEYREILYADAWDPNWAVRNKINGTFIDLKPVQGGKISYYPFVHTFDHIMPPAEFFAEHPEYFSLVNGERCGELHKTQLCLTNPDVLRICTERTLQWIDEHPDTTIFSLSQNDWWNNCECAHCREIDEAEGSAAGSLIHFVNQIAAVVGERYPHVVIDTLAYQYTRKAPKKLRPLPNVCVRLCSIECCFAHPLRECDTLCSFSNRPHSDSFQKDLQDWAKVCDRLYVWDYVVNFHHYLMPFPNFYVLADNIRYFIENNVKGIFEEGATSPYGKTEFAELRAYVLAKLLWNPHQDTDVLVDEFIAGYYGMAGPAVRDYFQLLHQKAADHPDRHFGIYDPPRINYLTDEVLAECEALFQRALSLAENDEISRRVQIAAMSIRYWQLYVMPLDNPDRAALSEQFFKELAGLGIAEIREGHSIKESTEEMRKGIDWRFAE